MNTDTAATPALTRDPKWEQWWDRLPKASRSEIGVLTASIRHPDSDAGDISHGLHWLMLEVFQRANPPFRLTVAGFPAATGVYASLDIDPHHDGDGAPAGVNIVATLWVDVAGRRYHQKIIEHVDKPARDLVPPPGGDHGQAAGWIIDRAAEIASAAMNDTARFWTALTRTG